MTSISNQSRSFSPWKLTRQSIQPCSVSWAITLKYWLGYDLSHGPHWDALRASRMWVSKKPMSSLLVRRAILRIKLRTGRQAGFSPVRILHASESIHLLRRTKIELGQFLCVGQDSNLRRPKAARFTV